jgi:hypothetical protein
LPLEDPLVYHVSRPCRSCHFLNSSPRTTTESVNHPKYLATGHFALHRAHLDSIRSNFVTHPPISRLTPSTVLFLLTPHSCLCLSKQHSAIHLVLHSESTAHHRTAHQRSVCFCLAVVAQQRALGSTHLFELSSALHTLHPDQNF